MAKTSLHVNISGMTCVNCSNAIEKVTKKLDGIESVKVNFSSSNGTFVYDDSIASKEKIVEKIKKLGFGVADDLKELEAQKAKELTTLKKDFYVALIFGLAVFILDKTGLFGTTNKWLMLIFATIVQFYSGLRFYTHAFSAVQNKNFDMNVLVALGTSMAYGYSAFVVLIPFAIPEHLRYLYFTGSVVIIAFILLGKYLEERSKAKATDFLKELINLSPKKAILYEVGKEKEVLVNSLKIDDVVVVKSGESISADGVIIEGDADIDTSMITGEALPQYKVVGDEVVAGTINKTGYLKIKVTKTTSNNMLSTIVSLLSNAQNQKMPIGRLADKVANVFVPAVIFIAISTFFIWIFVSNNILYGFLAFVCVLIISCPCALGLATPIAIVSAVGKGAKLGILIKNPEILEIIKDIKYAVFDKTGTLTKGEISVSQSTILDENMLSLIASLEKKSEHPISKAIVRFVEEKNLQAQHEVKQLKIIAGRGIKGVVDTKNILIGNVYMLEDEHIAITPQTKEFVKTNTKQGLGVVVVSVDGKEVGAFSLEDMLKNDAKKTISELKKLGITPIMLTGDNTQTALHVAKQLDIQKVYAEVLPHEKFETIKALQKEQKVLFVGDGINDSPSLKCADVGIALSSGADIAKDAGDIVLLNNKPGSVVKAIKLSHLGIRTIKQNLFWAFIYNIIGIPLAAGALYPLFGIMLTPMYAGMAMSISSVTVVLNSLRLKIAKI